MKRNFSAIALGIVLAYAAAPAFALGDTSTVDQTGTGNAANVNQTSSLAPGAVNYSAITQYGPAVQDSATVVQTNNLGFNQSSIIQQGSLNVGVVQQLNNNTVNAEISQGEVGNTASILQSNVDNSAIPAVPNAVIHQAGQGNIGAIYQHDGSTLVATINTANSGLAGYYNQAYIDQSGQNAKAGIEQYATAYSYATIGQSGSWNDASISQTGGDYNVAYTAQAGNGTGVGEKNQSMISQVGGANYASTTQWGNSKSSTVTQTGNNNSSVVWQH
jgi:hypothetical protein